MEQDKERVTEKPFRKRTKAREFAVQMMYSSEIKECGATEVAESFWMSFPGEEGVVKEFAENLFKSSYGNIDHDDELIKQFISKNWSFERIALVEKCILRLAINELFNGEAPVYAIVDDYVTLAKSFSDNKSASFINGVLESVRTKFSIERGNDERKQADKH